MAKLFPKDCDKSCEHFHAWDMSVDDWVCVCDLLGLQIDECDAYDGFHVLPVCPKFGTKGSIKKGE